MQFKNSVKILFSNFNMVWKAALYFLLLCVASIFLIYLCVNPVLDLLNRSGFVTEAVAIYADFLTSLDLTKLFASCGELITKVLDTLGRNIGKVWLNFSGIAIIVLFFNVLMGNLTIMPFCNSLNYYMGSMTKHGFFSSFGEVFWKNLKVQLLYFVFSLPFKVLAMYLFILALKLFTISWWVSILAVFAIVVGFVLLESFKYTIFVSWVPTMVILNYGVFKSLKIAFKNSFRRFGRTFGGAVGVVLVMIILNGLLGVFTFLVGLLISIPMSFMLYSSYGMIVTYEAQGMRYYVDIYNVITPKKKENSDKLSEMKYIV